MPRSGWARGPQLLSLRIWSLCSAAGGAAIVGGLRTAMKSGPRLPQLEKALAQKRRPGTAINKLKKLKKKKVFPLGRGWGWGKDWDQQIQTSIHRMDEQGPTVEHRELYSVSWDKP